MTRRGWLAVIGAGALAKLVPESLLPNPARQIGIRSGPVPTPGFAGVEFFDPQWDQPAVSGRFFGVSHMPVPYLGHINWLHGGLP